MLFNFPSRYLFAIGLATVFSLRWSLPPALGCILKQPDSEKTRSGRGKRPYGPDTRRGTKPRSEGHRRSPATALGLPYVTTRRARRARRFDAGLFPVHSPLLRESLLVSLPPLSNMLKFSGCSRLNSGRSISAVHGRAPRDPTPRRRRRQPMRCHRSPTAGGSSLNRTDPLPPPRGKRRHHGRAEKLGDRHQLWATPEVAAPAEAGREDRRARAQACPLANATLRQTRSRD